MAGPLSDTARAKSLANDFGPTRGPNSPDQFLIAIYDDNPEFGGVELDTGSCPGYARATVDNDDFAVGTVGMSVTGSMADATGAWTQIGRYLVLLNAADDTEAWDYTAISALRVREAGPVDDVEFTVFYSDDATTP